MAPRLFPALATVMTLNILKRPTAYKHSGVKNGPHFHLSFQHSTFRRRDYIEEEHPLSIVSPLLHPGHQIRTPTGRARAQATVITRLTIRYLPHLSQRPLPQSRT